jgi:hypothetical protein
MFYTGEDGVNIQNRLRYNTLNLTSANRTIAVTFQQRFTTRFAHTKMSTWDENLGGVFNHTNNTFGDFIDSKTARVQLGNNLHVCGFDLIKCLRVWTRNQDNVVRSDLVEISILANIFGKLAVQIIVVDICIDFAFGIRKTEEFDS